MRESSSWCYDRRALQIRVYDGNDPAALGARWLANVVTERRSELDPITVVTPHAALERSLEWTMAEGLGVTANLHFYRLPGLLARWVESTLGARLLHRRALESRALEALLDTDFLATAAMQEAAAYVHAEGLEDRASVELRCVELARRVAHLFERYALWNPKVLAAFRAETFTNKHPDARWQRALFQRIATQSGWITLPEALSRLEASREPPWFAPRPHVFAPGLLTPTAQRALTILGAVTDVHLYAFNPCQEFWEDITTSTEEAGDIDDLGESEALALWGRAGRAQLRWRMAVTDGDIEWADLRDLGPPSTLSRLQQSMLSRRPMKKSDDEDRSVQVWACPSARHEVATVAEAIWELFEPKKERKTEQNATPELRFKDIAVLIPPGREARYTPLIASVFDEARQIPFHIADRALASGSPIVDACLRLTALPQGNFSRRDVLELARHPCVRARFTHLDLAADREIDWESLVDKLGVFHGVDHTDHAGTYIERDVFNWDQALRRLALGALLGDRKDAVRIGDDDYFPEPPADTHGAALGALVRSLASDVRFARRQRLTLREWATFLQNVFRAYVVPTDTHEEADWRRCVAAAARLAERDERGHAVTYTAASALLRDALLALRGSDDALLARGVAVGSLASLRGVSFEAVFLVGMDEARFPAREPNDASDLRASTDAPIPKTETTATERDQWLFLERVACTRRALGVSWVARDEITGDPIAPSSATQQLLDITGLRPLPNPSPNWGEGEHEHSKGSDHWARRDEVEGRSPTGAPRALAHPEPASTKPTNQHQQTHHISLAQLRAFLHSPMQAWARAVVGIHEEDEDALRFHEDEPFAPAKPTALALLRRVFFRHLRESTPLETLINKESQRLQATGEWPAGALSAVQRPRQREVLESWLQQYQDISEHPPPAQVRVPTLRFDVSLGDTEDNTTTSVPIHGRTRWMLASPRVSLALRDTRPEFPAQRDAMLWRYAVDAFIDHVALSAADPAHHRPAVNNSLALHVIYPEETTTLCFAPIASPNARAYLNGLLHEFLGRPHAYRFPSNVVLASPREWSSLSGGELCARIERAHERDGGGRDRWGPVEDIGRYPTPSADDALAMARVRFGLMMEVAQW